MTKKTRLIILIICVVLFLIITPYIVLYSFGYRIDFENKKIIATGGIYVRVWPHTVDIIIDSKIKNSTSLFFNSIFVQNLLPKLHNVLIQKEGYYDYIKDIVVKEKEVIKLENIILFKKEILFELLKNNISYFSVAPNNSRVLSAKIDASKIDFEIFNLTNVEDLKSMTLLFKNGRIIETDWSQDSSKALINLGNNYFLLDASLEKPKITSMPLLFNSTEIKFNQQNSDEIFYIKTKNLYSNKQGESIIKNVVSYNATNQKIIYLSYDGILYDFNLENKTATKLTNKPLTLSKNNVYQIKTISNLVFLKENNKLFILDKNLKTFKIFYESVNDLKISPDGQRIVFFNDHEIMLSLISSIDQKVSLNKYTGVIKDVSWLNSDYLISKSGESVIISEIDYRGNINVITLPQTILLNEESFDIKKPNIFFNERDKKLYILTQNILLFSEPLIP